MRDTLEYLMAVLIVEGLGADGTISEDELDRIYDRVIPRIARSLDFDTIAVRDAFEIYFHEDYHNIPDGELDDLVQDAVDAMDKEFEVEELREFISIIKSATDFNLFSSANKNYIDFLREEWEV